MSPAQRLHTRVVRNDTYQKLLQTTFDSTRTRYKMAARTLLMLSAASSTTALQVPARRAGSVAPKTLRFVEVAERIQTSEEKAETFSAGDYLATLDRFGPDSAEPSNNIIASPFDAEPNAFDAMIDEAAEEVPRCSTASSRRWCRRRGPQGRQAADAVAEVRSVLRRSSTDDGGDRGRGRADGRNRRPRRRVPHQVGLQDDRHSRGRAHPAMQRIKDSGKAGVIARLTEGAFWIGSVPFAIAAVTLATGSFPDIASDEGKAAIGADAFIFINFARLIVPARIAFALGLAPWVDENIVKKFGGDEKEE